METLESGSKRSVDRRIALEAIRIRAQAAVTDTGDLDSFIKLARFDDHPASDGSFAPDLLEHFGKHHLADFSAGLEKLYKDVGRRGRIHELIAVVGDWSIAIRVTLSSHRAYEKSCPRLGLGTASS